MTLAIQFAMEGEARAFLVGGAFKPIASRAPFDFQLFADPSRELIVGYPGAHPRFKVDAIGTVAAALLTHQLLEQFKPRKLINAGTAGGFAARGGAIGDVYLGTLAVFHDRRIALEGFEVMGRGHFSVEHDEALAAKYGLKRGVVSTGDSLDCTPEDLRRMTELDASVKEMEAASIAWVCERHGVPLVLVKAITDLVDCHETTESQFLKNYPVAVARLATVLNQVVSYDAVPLQPKP